MKPRILFCTIVGALVALPIGFGAINTAQAAEDVLEEVVVTARKTRGKPA